MVKNPPAVWETWVWSLGGVPLEEETAAHSNILTWIIPVDRGAWRAIVRGVTKSWTRLSDWARTAQKENSLERCAWSQVFHIQVSFAFSFLNCRADGVMRTMAPEKLLKSMPILQGQIDALLEFDVRISPENASYTVMLPFIGKWAADKEFP